MVWWDPDVLRINYDGRGVFMGEFGPNDMVLVITRDGQFYTTSFDAGNHFDDNILRIEKFRPGHVWTAILNDADQGFPYIKRFAFEASARRQRYLGENMASTLVLLSDRPRARFCVRLGGDDAYRGSFDIDAEEFIGVKSFKAKGKRLTNYTVEEIVELEPSPDAVEEAADLDAADDETGEVVEIVEEVRSDDEVRDEINGQKRIF